MKKTASISECGLYRWWLARHWDPTKPGITWIMANPSTADHQKDDNTTKRVLAFSQAWGFGSYTIVNLFPFRSSQPRKCKAWFKQQSLNSRPMRINEKYIQMHSCDMQMVLVAWGAAGNLDRQYTQDTYQYIADAAYCLGVIKDGNPIHPSARGKKRIPEDQKPVKWEGLL